MSLKDLIKGVTTSDLTTFAREIKTPADYLLTNTVFPKVRINDVMWRVKKEGRHVNAAKYRSYDSSVPIADREAWQTTTEGLLPSLGQKLMVGEQELLLQIANHNADQDRLIELLYDDVERHVESIDSRLEVAAADVLIDGKLSIAGENGLTTEVDFGVPAANRPTAPNVWSDEAADPIRDELAWIEYLESIGAPLPELVVTSRTAYSTLASNGVYQAAYWGGVAPGTTSSQLLTPGQVDAVRAQYGLPPVQIYKAQVRVDGEYVRPLPDNLWIMLPGDRSKWGQTVYGTTAESLILSRTSSPQIVREDAPGLIVTRDAQDDPPQVWTKGSAVAMPVLQAPDCHIVAKVLP